jgi:hypothetical protein
MLRFGHDFALSLASNLYRPPLMMISMSSMSLLDDPLYALCLTHLTLVSLWPVCLSFLKLTRPRTRSEYS